MPRWLLVLLLCGCGACGGSNKTAATPTTPTPPPTPSPGSQRVFYVSPSGNDANDGSISGPWGTLRHAVAQLRAGDTLYLRGGTYRGPIATENEIDTEQGPVPSGTSWSNPITIAGYQGETAVIQPPASGNAFGIRLKSSAPSYLIFQDFVIDLSEQTSEAQAGVYVAGGANHNRFLRLEIRNSINFGVVFASSAGDAPFNEVVNCRIHNNGMPNGAETNGHGMYILTGDNLIDGNDVYDNQGYGIHVYDNQGPMIVSRNTISNNTVHGNGRHGGTAYGIVVAWGDSNVVHDNTVYGNPGGILIYTNSTNANVFNNTVHDNSPLEGILIQFATGTIINNNNVYGNGQNIVNLGTGTVLTNNTTR